MSAPACSAYLQSMAVYVPAVRPSRSDAAVAEHSSACISTEYSWKKKFLVFWWFTQQPHLMDIRGNQIVREWQLNTEITNALSHYYSENATEHKIYATRNWAFMNLCHIIICCLKITSLMALWLSYHGIMEHHNISPCGEEKHILRTRLPVESRMHWMHCRTEKNQNTLWKKK